MHIADLQCIGMTPELIGLCSGSLERPVQENLVVIGDMTVDGIISKVKNFANILQVAVDAGAKRALIPASSVADYQIQN